MVGILEYLRQHQIPLVSYRENIDLSTCTGKMLAGMFTLMAEYERNIISERTKAGLRAARARGRQMGRSRRQDARRQGVSQAQPRPYGGNAPGRPSPRWVAV